MVLCNNSFFFFYGRICFSVEGLFSCRPIYLRQVLTHNSGKVASLYQAIFEVFGYFSQNWFERKRSLEAGALLL